MAGLAWILSLFVVFIVAAGNGRRFWWSGLVPSLVVPPLVLTLLSRGRLDRIRVARSDLVLFAALSALALVACFSVIAAPAPLDTIVPFLGVYVAPLLLFVAFQHIEVDERRLVLAWNVLTLGALCPLVAGAIAYYNEWGIPTGLELLYSRYDVTRMQGYMAATFGNTGNTAAFLALLFPPWLVLAIRARALGASRAFYVVAIVVALLHIAIVQSRTLFVTLLVILPVTLLALRVRLRALMIPAFLGLGFLVVQLYDVRDQLASLTVGALEGSNEDRSVPERFEAMQIGVRLMRDNLLFGIGPGNSASVHPFTSSHQYWVNQGAELGVGGLLAAVALSVVVFWKFLRSCTRVLDGPTGSWRYVNLVGPAAFMLYGCIANMPWSANVVDTWAGLFGVMLGLAAASWAPRQDSVAFALE